MVLHIHALDAIRLTTHPSLRRRNVRFYRDLLGLPLVYDECRADLLLFRLHRRELRLEFAPCVAVNRNRWRAAFEVDDLQRLFRTLDEGGYRPRWHSGCSLATQRIFVSDPTGYRLELLRLWPMF
ncbi:MAG: VOC family protein [Phycisphaerae bacterium]|nr:VOC family protein [Phycisphaerae bacterium]